MRKSSTLAGTHWPAASRTSSSITRAARISATRSRDMGRFYRDYVELMAHFDEVLPGRVHRVLYERTVEDTEAEVRRLLDYCGLPFEPGCLRFFENDRPVRTASAEQVRQPIYRDGVEQWRHYEAWLGPLKDALGPVLDAYPAVPASEPRRILRRAAPALLPCNSAAYCSACCRFRCSLDTNWTISWEDRDAGFQSEESESGSWSGPSRRLRQCCSRSPGPSAAWPRMTHRDSSEVIVTAQKRAENLQDVPISIQALGTETLEELNIRNFKDYVQLLPTVTAPAVPTRRGLRLPAGVHARRRDRRRRPGDHLAAERRHVPGRAADHDGPGQPRHPHVRHRARRGARRPAGHAVRRELAGRHDPHHHQQAGPVRVRGGLRRSKATIVDNDDSGYVAEGFVNVPIGENAAVRLVGWYRRARPAGSTTSQRTRTFPGDRRRPGRRHPSQTTRNSPRTTTTPSRRSARARRCASTWATTGPSRPR